jgi:acyl carrier protein
MKKIETWAINYVTALDPNFKNLTYELKLSENIFSSGRVDSVALMTLLLEAEEKFNFMFTAENFQDRRLQTILGLVEIIDEITEKHD